MSASKRVLINIAALVSVIFFPWWITVLIVLYGCISGYFFEGVVYGFLMDSIFGIAESNFFAITFLVISVLVPIIKERVRLGSK